MATIQGQLNTPRESTFKTTEQTSRNIADVLADELSGIAQALGGSTDYDDLSHRPQINSVILTGDKSADDLSLAMQEDLTSIKATGTTNATGSTITKGTYFYLNGKLCLAKSDIANGATFTLNTNYEEVTAGALNSLNSAISTLNSSYIRGLKWKAFSYVHTGQTLAGTEYSVPNAKQTVFDLTSSDTIIGMSFRVIGGESKFVYTIPLYVDGSDELEFKPDATNSQRLRFDGIVFYL